METKRELQWAPVEQLLGVEPFPPRAGEEPLDILSSSIRLHGVICPILARRTASGELQIVCGYRRVLAARDAQIRSVPVLVASLDDAEAVRCYLTENTARRELDAERREEVLEILRRLRGAEPRSPIEAPRREAGTLGQRRADAAVDILAAPRADRVARRSGSYRGASEVPEFPNWQDFVHRIEILFARLRATRSIDREEAESIARDLLEARDEHGRIPSSSEVSDPDMTMLDWLGRHSLWVALLVAELAPTSPGSLDRHGYAVAGLLHDCGLVLLGTQYLEDPDAYEVRQPSQVRSHPRLGHALVSALGKDYAEIALAARDHHERLDGTGYPEGRRESLLGDLARVTAVASSFAWTVGERPLHDSRDVDAARAILERSAESGALDPAVVRRFLALPLDATPLPRRVLTPQRSRASALAVPVAAL
jgi:hypothetical protein